MREIYRKLASSLHPDRETDERERAAKIWMMDFNVPPFAETDPRRLGSILEREKRAWRGDLARLQKELRMLADVPATKRWLKRQRQRLRQQEWDLDGGLDLPF